VTERLFTTRKTMKTRLALLAFILASLTPQFAQAAKVAQMPSARLEPLLEPCLDAILAPLEQNPKMPRVKVETLRATFAGGMVTASTPAGQQIYQNAMAVCDAMTADMDARAKARAAAQAAAAAPTLSTGGDIIDSAPMHGWDAGADAQAIRQKQKDERNYEDKSARTQSAFTESSAYTAWVNNAPTLRQQVMSLYTRQVELEALAAKNAQPPPAPAQETADSNSKPGGTDASSSKTPYVGVGTWTHDKRQLVIAADHTVVRVEITGKKDNGTWSVDDQGHFHATFDNGSMEGNFSSDGKNFTTRLGTVFNRNED
jgi:hypothetical protein